MLVVISPAKNLDYDSPSATSTFSQPEMLDDSQKLIKRCKKLSPAKIGSLMKISDKLAGLNADRYASWHTPFDESNAKQAMLAFNGDVYAGLDAHSFSHNDFDYAQQHLRILSGLYGVLRPLDLMQAYRLEMGTSLKVGRKDNLYKFWDKKITQAINDEMVEGEPFINLASNEYFSAVKPEILKTPVITPIFKDFVNGKLKVVSFHAKKARGMMVRYILDKNIEEAEELKTFNYGNYEFDVKASTKSELVFIR